MSPAEAELRIKYRPQARQRALFAFLGLPADTAPVLGVNRNAQGYGG